MNITSETSHNKSSPHKACIIDMPKINTDTQKDNDGKHWDASHMHTHSLQPVTSKAGKSNVRD